MMKMKKLKKVMMTATLMAALAGCGNESKGGAGSSSGSSVKTVSENTVDSGTKTAVCFLVGQHANSQGLNFNSQIVQYTLYQAVRGEGYVAVVVVDGDPEKIFEESYELDARFKDAAPEKLDMDARRDMEDVLGIMQEAVADDPEIDYYEGLRNAARVLNALSGYDQKKIICIGTCISTTGVASEKNNLILADPQTVVDMLDEREELIDFSGIEVVVQQLGDTEMPQKEPSAKQKKNLAERFQKIVEAGGGMFTLDDTLPEPADTSKTYPEVSVVEFPEADPVVVDPEAEIEIKEDEVFIFQEDQVEFLPGKAIYKEEAKAEKVIRPFAEYLAGNNKTILLCGSTAGDEDDEETILLSKQRAEAVKNTILKLVDVDEKRILTLGLGSHDPWHISGLDLDSPASSQNRKVILMSAECDMAKELLGN